MSASHDNLEALLEQALTRSPKERAAFLAGVCGNDHGLRKRLEVLLAAHEAAGNFLPTDPGIIADAPGGKPTISLAPVTEQPGSAIGRYKLLEKVGEGGCGVVYVAEQTEPVRRRVALKVIKLGMDTKQVVARFEAERQALAMMDHPNIAKVLDAGGTEMGRPFFVMELVRGIRITDYCDQNNVSTKERLDLFIKVCQAVQHAHQKGIIHRDLKPSNILVTVNDGVAVPKVIDFGIAKAIEQKLTDKTLFTQFQQFLGTPAYMSPEQAELSSLDIDTRGDIYSLGVLLYELLTGTTPFDAQELVQAGFDAMRRIIRETEPEKPSTRLSTRIQRRKGAKEKGSRDAGAMLQSDPTLNSQLKLLSTDLDWIVMKCLEKDRARRYETANGLAADVQRHLANEPVMARPPTNLYRCQKMIRRNKALFTAVSAVAGSLIIGLGISTWLFFKESAARSRAVAQQQRAEDAEKKAADEARRAGEESAVAEALNHFLLGVFSLASTTYQADQAEVFRQPANPNLKVVEALDLAARNIGDQFRDQPLVEASIRHTIGLAYHDLGDDLAAIPQLERVLELRRRGLGPEHDDTLNCMHALGLAYFYTSRLTEAIALFEEQRRFETAQKGSDNVDLRILVNLGMCYLRSDRIPEAVRLMEDALKRREAKHGRNTYQTAMTMNALAVVYFQAHQPDQGIALSREALGILRATVGPDHPNTILLTYNLAVGYLDTGKRTEAVPFFEEAFKLYQTRLGATHPDTLNAAKMLADTYHALGREAEAEVLYRESLDTARSLGDAKAERRIPSLRSLADYYSGQGRFGEAEPLYREAWQLAQPGATIDPSNLDLSLNALAGFLCRQRRYAELDVLFSQTLETANPPPAAGVLHWRGIFRARSGRWQDATSDFAKAIELEPALHEHHHALAPLLVQSGDLDGYRLHRQKILRIFASTTDPVVAERMAKDCLILPLTGSDLEAVVRMAGTAVSAATNHPFIVYFQHVKSLPEYRRGHFAEAADWANQVMSNAGGDPHRDAQSCLVLAMAQHQLSHADEARAALARGVEITENNLPTLDSGDLGGGWNDWIIVQALLREAKTLIEGQSRHAAEAEKNPASPKEPTP